MMAGGVMGCVRPWELDQEGREERSLWNVERHIIKGRDVQFVLEGK